MNGTEINKAINTLLGVFMIDIMNPMITMNATNSMNAYYKCY